MPSGKTYEQINCKCCGRLFTPSQAGHEYCKHKCRWTGPKPPEEWEDWAAIERLWDPSRDENEQARDDDWIHAVPTWRTDESAQSWRRLEAYQTVGRRRLYYKRLKEGGYL